MSAVVIYDLFDFNLANKSFNIKTVLSVGPHDFVDCNTSLMIADKDVLLLFLKYT